MSNLFFAGLATLASIDASAVCLYATWAAREKLLARGVQPRRLWDTVTTEVGAAVDELTLDIATHWYRDGEQDLTLLGGVSLGGIHEWTLWLTTILPVYKFVVAASPWVAQEQPARVWMEDGLDPHWFAALDQVCRRWAPAAWLGRVTSPGQSGALRPWQPQTIRRVHYLAASLWNAAARLVGWQPPRPSCCRVLYFNYHALEPILQELLNLTGRRFCVMMGDRPSPQSRLRALGAGIPLLLPDPTPLDEADQQAVRRIRDHWSQISTHPEFVQKFAWNGVDVWPALCDDLSQWVQSELPRTARLARGYLRALERARPDCVLVPFDSAPLQRAAIEAARRLGIPSVAVLHGLPGIYHWGAGFSRADYLLAWGKSTADEFVRLGRRPETVFRIGFPGYATYRQISHQKSDSAQQTILLLTNPFNNNVVSFADDDTEIYLFNALDALTGLSQVHLILRPHPSESPRYYQELLAARNLDIQIASRESIPSLLSHADLVIGPISTVLIEAMAAGVPVLCVNFGKMKYPAPFDGNWGTPLITDVPTLRVHIDRFLRGDLISPSQQVLDAFCGPCDDQAVARTLNAIEVVARRGGSAVESLQ